MTHICVGKLTIIGSDNGLSPGRRQAIIWTNAGILLIEPLGTNFSEILIGIQTFSFKKMRLKMASAKWRPFCLGLNVLRNWDATLFTGCSSQRTRDATVIIESSTSNGNICTNRKPETWHRGRVDLHMFISLREKNCFPVYDIHSMTMIVPWQWYSM